MASLPGPYSQAQVRSFAAKLNSTAGIENDFGHDEAIIIKSYWIFCKWYLALRKEENGIQSGCL
ncbi:MAG: hypothetical protein WBN63_05160 [Eudoraea sp.]|uniref:hypothetical protein n=1 Tax=Eudoraea sp. TaxID=1979955 RepID=UPI003C74869A